MTSPMSEIGPVFDCLDAPPHAFIGYFRQPACLNRGFADVEHATGIAVKTVLDHRDIDVNDISGLEFFRPRHPVADDVVDRCADGLRVGLIAGRRVVQRRGYRVLHVDHVVVAKRIDFVGGYIGPDVRRNEVQHLGRKTAGDTHFFDFFGGFDGDGHD